MTKKGGRGATSPKQSSSSKPLKKLSSKKKPATKTSLQKKPSSPRDKASTRVPPSSPPVAPDTLPHTRYLFFGGKGGVGKTTAASAAALLLLEQTRNDDDTPQQPPQHILLFSTDPAHSLSDSLGVKVGDRTIEVARHDSAKLFAREMDAARALEDFKTQHRAVLAEIANRGTLLDEADINEMLDLSLPGMDEVMSLFELSEIEASGSYARVVVDTAPSGHTSRLLRLPEVFARWTHALDLMAEKHRFMVAHFARGARTRADEVDLFLRDLTARISRVRAMLYDARAASFTLVTIPEAMSVEETRRYLALLRGEKISVTDIIVNRVERQHEDCPFCRARAASQRRSLKEIEIDFADLRIRRVPLLGEEVRGTEALRNFGRLAWGLRAPKETEEIVGAGLVPARSDSLARGQGQALPLQISRTHQVSLDALNKEDAGTTTHDVTSDAKVGARGGSAKKNARVISSPRAAASAPSPFRLEPRRLIIFGGKGGVGKTTSAAAAALALAQSDSEARVLVFSTDPAHSLSDSFGEPVGELKRGVAGQKNLDAMEIDPAARFEELKERYRAWTDELFDSLSGGSRFEVQFDREAMREIVALAPPGIDEIAALSRISDLVEADAYTTIVLDTAPTGHLVRFLELPAVALSWVRTFIKLLLKYKDVVRWGGVAEELVALSKSIKRVAALLTDAEQCEFVGVAIPERMSLEETTKLAATLSRLNVPMRRLLINNTVTDQAAAACDFCLTRHEGQLAALADYRRKFARAHVRLFSAPQQPREIIGRERLLEHFSQWRMIEDGGGGGLS